MAGTYYTIVTDLGTREMAKAINEGRKVNIIEFAAGDGGGSPCTPKTDQVTLKNEVWRGNVGTCYINEDAENLLIVEAVMPADVGGFTIREMAVFDDRGTMIAVCNTPDTPKVKISDGVVHELRLQMEILLNNQESARLLVDPHIVTATKKELENLGIKLNEKIEELKERIDESEWSIATEPIIKQIAHDCLKGMSGTITLPASSRVATDDEVNSVKEKIMEILNNATGTITIPASSRIATDDEVRAVKEKIMEILGGQGNQMDE